MILRHALLLLQFLLWQCIFSQEALSVEIGDVQDAEEEYVRVMVGFHDRQEERHYVRMQRLQPRTASGKPKTKVHYEFQKTEAVAMEVTRAELEEMKKDNRKFRYIEEDISVPVASSSITNKSNATTLHEQAEEMRKLSEVRSYGIRLTQAHRTIDADPTWDQECGVYVCVVDSGVFIDNADIPYSRGDGYVNGKTFGGAEGQDWYYPRDTSHGTEVAGIMIARGGNDRGVVGVIPQGPQRSNVCLRVAKVVPDGSGAAYISALLQGSEWCAEEAGDKPVVINLSFAVNIETSVERAIYQKLYDQGNVLLVAAAGNMGNSAVSYPAAHDSVISVASVGIGSLRSNFSQFNDKVELSAPGENIQVLQDQTNEIKISAGTSLSSPFVAGLAARIWAAVPRCTNKQIRQALRDTARPLAGQSVPSREYGYGLIRARDAHDLLVTSDCNNAPSAQPTTSPSVMPSQSPSITPSSSAMPSAQPTTSPSSSAIPSTQPSSSPSAIPSQSPSVACFEHLEPCTFDTQCCKGFACRRMRSNNNNLVEDSSWLVCRRELSSPILDNSRPRLASMDGNICRGGYGGGCNFSY